jgi:DNA sulfur modification protein DndD
MIIFDSLHLENFGPYINETLEFGGHKGVLAFHAKNGIGKTTMFEAFEWVIKGEISEKPARVSSPESYMNSLSEQICIDNEQDFSMKVTLKLSVGGDDYQIRRTLKKIKGTGDAKDLLSLQKNGAVLTQAETDAALKEIIPDSMSLLMFVDGEMMDALLKAVQQQTGQTVHPVVKQIEKSLGITTIESLSAELNKLHSQTTNELRRVKGISRVHLETSNNLQTVNERISQIEESIKSALESYTIANTRIERIESDFKKDEDSRAIIEEKARWEGKLAAHKEMSEESRSKLRESAKDSWKFLLDGSLPLKIKKLRTVEKRSSQKLRELQQGDHLHTVRKESFESGKCLICDSSYSNDPGSGETPDYTKHKGDLQAVQDALRVLEKPDTRRSRESLERSFRSYVSNEASYEKVVGKIKECAENLSPVNQEGMLRLAKEYENQTAIRGSASEQQRRAEEEKRRLEAKQSELNSKLQDMPGNADQDRLVSMLDLTLQIKKFFDESVEKLREDKRLEVEKYSSDLFAAMTVENEWKHFTGLSLTKNYEMAIVNEDGTPQKLGAGHTLLSLLSLIGGIQKAGFMQTPIIFDSALGKLDDENAKGLLRNLPLLVHQSLILVHDREATPDTILAGVGGENLIAQVKVVAANEARTDAHLVKV